MIRKSECSAITLAIGIANELTMDQLIKKIRESSSHPFMRKGLGKRVRRVVQNMIEKSLLRSDSPGKVRLCYDGVELLGKLKRAA